MSLLQVCSGLSQVLDFSLRPVLVLVLVPVLVLVLAPVLFLVWALDLSSSCSVPEIHNRESELNQYLQRTCPGLTQRYVPPFWGRSGHVQTWVYALIGRFRAPRPSGRMYMLQLSDGSLASFKLFTPNDDSATNDKDGLTVALCPGFCNHSEQRYVRSFVDFSLKHGLRCSVLNHQGAPPSLPLTTARVFSYGGTEAFGSMVQTLKSWFPGTRLVFVGFSLGANIVCKYLGEDRTHQDQVLCGLSLCQAYSATRAHEALTEWTQGRRLYNYILTNTFRRLLLRHRQTLFSPDEDLKPLFRATSLSDIDQYCIRKFWGYSRLEEYYETESCQKYLHNISVPLLLVNSSDDPLVPQSLLQIPQELADHSPLVTFLLTSHGGHLGFFEGRILPQSGSWIDRVLLQYISAIYRRDQTMTKSASN